MNNSAEILLVEDNPADADFVRLRLLESQPNLNIFNVNRLADALTKLEQNTPELVLLDLNLPDSRGAETFLRVIGKAPKVPVVILSGQDDEELAVKALHQGVQDYLVKGHFDGKQLARSIQCAIERQQMLTALDASRKQQLLIKDQFLSHVSHELRTPLTSIHQFVTILLDGLAGPLPDEQRGHLETVLRSVNQSRAMIADLQEANRTESGKTRIERRCIALEEVIHQAVAMLQASAHDKKIYLRVEIEGAIPLVHADPDRVIQVLINLIQNAIKFTPPKGSVVVNASMLESDQEFAYISVTDSGVGVSAEARPFIFERLYQGPHATSDRRKGLGLGLYIAKELVGLHGGRMWLKTQQGDGSTFCFTLPFFSLARLLTPVITSQNTLRDAVSLITVEVTPAFGIGFGNWRELRNRCLDVLGMCIAPEKDLLLPAVATTRSAESFIVVVAANLQGARVILSRIRAKLDRNPELEAAAKFRFSTVPITLPEGGSRPLVELIQQVANAITGTVMARLRRKAIFDSLSVGVEEQDRRV